MLVTPDRFWKHVKKLPGKDSCWVWTSQTNVSGHGRMRDHENKKWVYAHRYSWFLEHGEMPKIGVLHRCDNPPCVRPSHLFTGTNSDNNRDRHTKGRTPCGEKSGQAKITEVQALEILELAKTGMWHVDISRKTGISYSIVIRIVKGQLWKHLPRIDYIKRTPTPKPKSFYYKPTGRPRGRPRTKDRVE